MIRIHINSLLLLQIIDKLHMNEYSISQNIYQRKKNAYAIFEHIYYNKYNALSADTLHKDKLNTSHLVKLERLIRSTQFQSTIY